MENDYIAKIIAFYFPQFHAIPENDEWWGKGFTDWDNVKRAKPIFNAHYQPRIPKNDNYYDQSNIETIKWQVELAKKNGIAGFCHYHYWFAGKQLLETPTNLLINSKEINMPFCLAWANETWSRRWDGQDHYILQQQTHEPDIFKWREHFSYLIKAWIDDRAIRIDGKPIFVIYRPQYLIDAGRMFEFWQEEVLKYGLNGIYFIAMKQHKFPDPTCLKHFDAVIQFQPFEAMFSTRHSTNPFTLFKHFLVKNMYTMLPHQIERLIFKFQNKISSPTIIDYDNVWSKIIRRPQEQGITTYPGAFVDWDNTARYGRRATIFSGASPEKFEYWLSKLITKVASTPSKEPFIFLNAWNEWSEGTYLEPDERYGKNYLKALASSINRIS